MSQNLNFYEQRTIKWDDGKNAVVMIDQTLLPQRVEFLVCETVDQVIDAIKTMKIRGAPAIGVAGAMGVALAVASSKAETKDKLLKEIEPDVIALRSARPTAVNLAWGVDKTVDFIRSNVSDSFTPTEEIEKVVSFVKRIADEDVQVNKKLSDLGAKLFRTNESVLTHCK